jgi:hypothetical protein
MVVGLTHARKRGVAIGDVEFDRQDGVAVRGGEVVERRGIARCGGKAVTCRERRLRERTTEAAGRAGDEPDAISDVAPLPGGVQT